MAGRIAKLPHFNASGDEWLSVNYVKEISNTINLIAKVDLIILGTLKEQIFQAFTKLALNCVTKSAEDRPTINGSYGKTTYKIVSL